MTIKQILTNNWAPKLTCLTLAGALWYLISQNVEKNPSRPEYQTGTEFGSRSGNP